MADILSQKEIDDLVGGLAAEAGAADGLNKARRGRRVRVYDFRRPDKLSKEQMRTLQMVHDNMARLLTSSFSAYFRTMVQVGMASADQMTYEEFVQTVHGPTVLAVISLPPLSGNALVEVQPALAFPMIDRLFGGPGHAPEKVRPLTEIENTVMERVLQGFLASFREAWKNIADVSPRLEAIETNPLFAQIASANEMVAAISLEVRIGESRGLINLCVPYLVMEPVIARLSAHHWFGSARRQGSADAPALVQRHLEEATVPVAVRLGQTRVTLGELLDLDVGDVVRLDDPAGGELKIVVGDGVKFTGFPGTLGRRMAVRIARVLD
ncbi:MAG: flagellar motor switch protein FliM [Acetobacteraceae bacterium]|nr:flagellar motor switch protein FliM [Acetobacteraceae bacterium]